MQRRGSHALLLLACAVAVSCHAEPGAALDLTLRLTGAGVWQNEGRTYVGSPTLTDSARLDSLNAFLDDGRWERVESPYPSDTYAIKLWRDSTLVGILWIGPEYASVLPLTRNPVRTRRRVSLRERGMLDRWFGI